MYDLTNLLHDLPMVLIMLLEVADAAAKILVVLPAVRPPEVLLLLPTVLTAKPPEDVFFTGTTTLLQKNKTDTHSAFHTHDNYMSMM